LEIDVKDTGKRVKDKVLLQLFNKSKFRNKTKTFLEPKFLCLIFKCKKLGFSGPLFLYLQYYTEIEGDYRTRVYHKCSIILVFKGSFTLEQSKALFLIISSYA